MKTSYIKSKEIVGHIEQIEINNYREHINSIFNKYKKCLNVSNNEQAKIEKRKILEAFMNYCEDWNIEGVNSNGNNYLYSLVCDYNAFKKQDDTKEQETNIDKIIKSYLKNENSDFFFYALKSIKRLIKKAQVDEKLDSFTSKVDKKIYKKLCICAEEYHIDIYNNKVNKDDIKLLGEALEIDECKVKEYLKNILNSTLYYISSNESEEDDDGDKKNGRNISKDKKDILEEKEEKEAQQSQLQKLFKLINDVYSRFSKTRKKTMKVVLINYCIKKFLEVFEEKLKEGEFAKENILYLFEQLKFYDLSDNNIKYVVDQYKNTGNCLTAKELAQLLEFEYTSMCKTITKLENSLKVLSNKL